MATPLRHLYGDLLIVRAPVPATCNKAGANYRSEITHLEYEPRRAFDEWLAICEGILACGGDALFELEEQDEPLLDRGDLEVDADGSIHPVGSTERLGHMDEIMTGRVFTANGPWIAVGQDRRLRALMPNMLEHRRGETVYYAALLERIAADTGLELEIVQNPHRWEGMADVAAVGDRAVLSYTVSGHYDHGLSAKTARSSRAGVAFAAEFAGVPSAARIFVELSYPHFHGDTVCFCARPGAGGDAVLVCYPGGLFGDSAAELRGALGDDALVEIGRSDAVDAYAANSRQVGGGVLVPDGVSSAFVAALARLGLRAIRIPLTELFGKAGGGPACATLHVPANLDLDERAPIRYSVSRARARAHRNRIPQRLTVATGFFAGRTRG